MKKLNYNKMSITKAPKRKYQICKRCVMDTSDLFIKFDENGICNHCNDYINKRLIATAYQYKKEDSLETYSNM